MRNMDDFLRHEVGAGQVDVHVDGVRLYLGAGDGRNYGNAQMDDYHAKGILRWHPPVELCLRARFSANTSALCGTAGFGFWNDPFAMTQRVGRRRWFPRVRLPKAVWFFFASSPSNMALAKGVPGFGWKAATIDADTLLAKCLLPLAPLGVLACRVPWLYAKVWPVAQRVLKIDEKLVHGAMDEWHEYRLIWEGEQAHFYVDGELLFCSRFAPHGPLGFVLWIDNQMMIATPQGQVRGGVVHNPEQWLVVRDLTIR